MKIEDRRSLRPGRSDWKNFKKLLFLKAFEGNKCVLCNSPKFCTFSDFLKALHTSLLQPQVNLANDCCMRKWTQVERKIKVKSLWFCESADTTEYMNDPKVELHCVCVCCFIFWKRFHSRMISWGSFSNSFQKKCQSTPHFMLKKPMG